MSQTRTPVERARYEPGEGFDASQGLALPEEIAELYRVERSTVMQWARAGRIPHIITPGRHYRLSFAYPRQEIAAQVGDDD